MKRCLVGRSFPRISQFFLSLLIALTVLVTGTFGQTGNTVSGPVVNLDSSAFGPMVEFVVGGGQETVTVGDLDGDGRLDLVCPNYGGGLVAIFQNVGQSGTMSSASFGPRIDLPAGGLPMGLAVGDVDGDGKLDIVVATRGGVVSVFRNLGGAGALASSSFAARVDFPVFDGELRTVSLGDLDGDGRLDVVVGSANARVIVLRNVGANGVVNFATPFVMGTGGQVVSLVVGDIDGDGKLDILACNFDGYTTSIFRNNSTPGSLSSSSFDTRFDLPAGYLPFGIALADIDGDGKPELFAINYAGGDLYVFPNVGAPGASSAAIFGRPVIFPAAGGCFTVAVGDVNGDKKPDVVVANSSQNTASVFLNRSTGPGISSATLAPRLDYPAGAGPRAALLADMDGDKRLDILIARQGTDRMTVLRNNLLFVLDPPVIDLPPASQTLRVGATVTLTVQVSGDGPFNYQWRLNGASLPGANGASLDLPNAVKAQSGKYSVSVSNGGGTTVSPEALVIIDTPPVAQPSAVSVLEDGSVSFNLVALDADKDPLGYTVTGTAHGRLFGLPPALEYYPDADYHGPDSLVFQVSDGIFSSDLATVTITVVPVNHVPAANDQSVNVPEDSTVGITLTGFDRDGDSLTFAVGSPQHGTLSGTSPTLVYAPEADYFGSDSFTFTVNDGVASSASATVAITVLPVADAPLARFEVGLVYAMPFSTNRLAVLARSSSGAAVTLDGSLSTDPEHRAMHFSWCEGPTAPFASGVQVTRNFAVGTHSITLMVDDGEASATATGSFEVITPAAVVEDMRPLVEAAKVARKHKRYLVQSLDAAIDSLNKDHLSAALGELSAFEHKVRAQIAPADPDTAALLTSAAEALMQELKTEKAAKAARAGETKKGFKEPKTVRRQHHKTK